MTTCSEFEAKTGFYAYGRKGGLNGNSSPTGSYFYLRRGRIECECMMYVDFGLPLQYLLFNK